MFCDQETQGCLENVFSLKKNRICSGTAVPHHYISALFFGKMAFFNPFKAPSDDLNRLCQRFRVELIAEFAYNTG
jgi:hypothetical protein